MSEEINEDGSPPPQMKSVEFREIIAEKILAALGTPVTRPISRYTVEDLMGLIQAEHEERESITRSMGKLQEQAAANLREIAEALEIDPTSVTVHELVRRARIKAQAADRSDRYNSEVIAIGTALGMDPGDTITPGEVARKAKILVEVKEAIERNGIARVKAINALRERIAGLTQSCDHFENVAASWQGAAEKAEAKIKELTDQLDNAQQTIAMDKVVMDQLRADVDFARSNAEIHDINMQSFLESHERREAELREKFELRSAKRLVRALKAEKLVRQLRSDIEELVAQIEQRRGVNSDLLHKYDRLTLALEFLWGHEKKTEFINKIEDETSGFMHELELAWGEKFPEEDPND